MDLQKWSHLEGEKFVLVRVEKFSKIFSTMTNRIKRTRGFVIIICWISFYFWGRSVEGEFSNRNIQDLFS